MSDMCKFKHWRMFVHQKDERERERDSKKDKRFIFEPLNSKVITKKDCKR